MGCCGSSSVETERADVMLQPLNDLESQPTFNPDVGTFRGAFNVLTSKVQNVSFGNFGAISLSMNKTSMPIIYAETTVQPYFTNVRYPVLSINCTQNSRIAAFSSTEILKQTNFHSNQTKLFLTNIIIFLRGNNLSKNTLIIADEPELFMQRFDIMQSTCTIGNFSTDFSPYSVIIIATSQKFTEQNIDAFDLFLSKGGGICVFYKDSQFVNYFLNKYGLAFQKIEHISEHPNYDFKLISTISEGRSNNFTALTEKLQNMLTQNVDENDFDDMAFQVRLHLFQSKDTVFLSSFQNKLSAYLEEHNEKGQPKNNITKICELFIEDIQTIGSQ